MKWLITQKWGSFGVSEDVLNIGDSAPPLAPCTHLFPRSVQFSRLQFICPLLVPSSEKPSGVPVHGVEDTGD